MQLALFRVYCLVRFFTNILSPLLMPNWMRRTLSCGNKDSINPLNFAGSNFGAMTPSSSRASSTLRLYFGSFQARSWYAPVLAPYLLFISALTVTSGVPAMLGTPVLSATSFVVLVPAPFADARGLSEKVGPASICTAPSSASQSCASSIAVTSPCSSALPLL